MIITNNIKCTNGLVDTLYPTSTYLHLSLFPG
uniref:Uncharacterized protein n=1 Tax=virus sp. ctx9V1 TaxID=2828001 RepID=A0A8S5RE11_9VIRU|nr:MAG TPA: hypothetical protein [virus sp. ctx9V1]